MNVDISNYMLHDQKVIFETIKIFQNWHMVNNTQTTVPHVLQPKILFSEINNVHACKLFVQGPLVKV